MYAEVRISPQRQHPEHFQSAQSQSRCPACGMQTTSSRAAQSNGIQMAEDLKQKPVKDRGTLTAASRVLRDAQPACCCHDQLPRHYTSALSRHEEEQQHKFSLPNLQGTLELRPVSKPFDSQQTWRVINRSLRSSERLNAPSHMPFPIQQWLPGTLGWRLHTGVSGRTQDTSATYMQNQTLGPLPLPKADLAGLRACISLQILSQRLVMQSGLSPEHHSQCRQRVSQGAIAGPRLAKPLVSA